MFDSLKQTISRLMNEHDYIGLLSNQFNQIQDLTKIKVQKMDQCISFISDILDDPQNIQDMIESGAMSLPDLNVEITGLEEYIDTLQGTTQLISSKVDSTTASISGTTIEGDWNGSIYHVYVNDDEAFSIDSTSGAVVYYEGRQAFADYLHQTNESINTVQQLAQLNEAFMRDSIPTVDDLESIYGQFADQATVETQNLYSQMVYIARTGGDRIHLVYAQLMNNYFSKLNSDISGSDPELDFSAYYSTSAFVTIPFDQIITTVGAGLALVGSIIAPLFGLVFMGIGWIATKFGEWIANDDSTYGTMEYSSSDEYTYANSLFHREIEYGDAMYNTFSKLLLDFNAQINQILKIRSNNGVIYFWKIPNGHIRYEVFLNCIWSPTIKGYLISAHSSPYDSSIPSLRADQFCDNIFGSGHYTWNSTNFITNSTPAGRFWGYMPNWEDPDTYEPDINYFTGNIEYAWKYMKSMYNGFLLSDDDFRQISEISDPVLKDKIIRILVTESLSVYELFNSSSWYTGNSWCYFDSSHQLGNSATSLMLQSWYGNKLSLPIYSAEYNWKNGFSNYIVPSWSTIISLLSYEIPDLLSGGLSEYAIDSYADNEAFPNRLTVEYGTLYNYFAAWSGPDYWNLSLTLPVYGFSTSANVIGRGNPLFMPPQYYPSAWVRLAIDLSLLAITVAASTVAIKLWQRRCRIKAWAAEKNADLIAFGETPAVDINNWSEVKAWYKSYRKTMKKAAFLSWLGGGSAAVLANEIYNSTKDAQDDSNFDKLTSSISGDEGLMDKIDGIRRLIKSE